MEEALSQKHFLYWSPYEGWRRRGRGRGRRKTYI
jgi:hypothetical protein